MAKPTTINTASKYLKKVVLNLHDHFIPHERNNHRPHFLSHRALVGYSVLLILIKILVIVAPIALPSSSLFSSAITVDNIISLTNQTRINLGLSELKKSNVLDIAAANKAQDMLLNQYFAHTSPAGLSPWDFIKKAGYNYTYAGENLAVHFVSAESVQDGWMASPSHRANIVNTNYTEIGIGVVNGDFEGYPTTFVVQMFATPLVKQPESVKVATVTTTPTTTVTTQPTALTGQVESAVESNPLPESIKEVVPELVMEKNAQSPESPFLAPVSTDNTEVVNSLLALSPVNINEDSLLVKWTNTGYDVSIEIFNAQAVSLQLGSQVTPLQFNTEQGLWWGSVSYDSQVANRSGELLSAIATAQDGNIVTKSLVWVAPQVATQNLYNFQTGSDKFVKFLGFFTVHNLDDKVTQFYFYFMILLAAALLINIFVKIKIQHLSVISHALIVIILSIVLVVV